MLSQIIIAPAIFVVGLVVAIRFADLCGAISDLTKAIKDQTEVLRRK